MRHGARLLTVALLIAAVLLVATGCTRTTTGYAPGPLVVVHQHTTVVQPRRARICHTVTSTTRYRMGRGYGTRTSTRQVCT